jgi:sugar fermentation stimulation protein A
MTASFRSSRVPGETGETARSSSEASPDGAFSLPASVGLSWPPLVQGTLLRRYKRFIADVRLSNDCVVTAHCPNSGSMKGCSEPGKIVYLSESANPARRLRHTWELIEMPTSLVCVNTLVTNRLVRQAVVSGFIPDLAGYGRVRSEVNTGRGSRIDLVLEGGGKPPCFVEIKSSTLVEGSRSSFPDAVTSRGLKHLKELQEEVRVGNRSVSFFLIQRMDAVCFGPADHIDPAYGRELREAIRNGVEIMCYDVTVDGEYISLRRPVPVQL